MLILNRDATPHKPIHAHLMWMLLGILFSISNVSHGQKADRKFYKLFSANKLPNNSVLAITQDSSGFMWFGTAEGLSRYDGSLIRTYVNNPKDSLSISSNNITTLLTDKKGNVWVGTGNGLNKLNPKKGNFKRYWTANPKVNLKDRIKIKHIFEDRYSQLWVGTSQGILYRNSKANPDHFTKLKNPIDSTTNAKGINITGICQDAKGFIWVGADTYIVKYSQDGQRLAQFDYAMFLNNKNKFSFIRSLNIDNQQRIWIGGDGEARDLFNTITQKFEKLTQYHLIDQDIQHGVFQISKDSKNGMWMATSNGLFYYNDQSHQKTVYRNSPEDPKSLEDNNVLSVFIAKNGIVWIGTYTSGVQYILPHDNRFRILTSGRDGLTNNLVTSIAPNGDNKFLVGTSGGGVDEITADIRKISSLNHLKNQNINAVFKARNGDIWIAANGVTHFDNKKKYGKTISIFLPMKIALALILFTKYWKIARVGCGL